MCIYIYWFTVIYMCIYIFIYILHMFICICSMFLIYADILIGLNFCRECCNVTKPKTTHHARLMLWPGSDRRLNGIDLGSTGSQPFMVKIRFGWWVFTKKHIGISISGVPQNGWFLMENQFLWMMDRYPYFRKHPYGQSWWHN